MSNSVPAEKQSLIKSLLKLMRPKQWVKNGFVVAPLIFAGGLLNIKLFTLAFCGAVLFSLAASAVYIINDIVDREKDKKHPKKCRRPIASGAVSIKAAVILLLALLITVFAASIYLNILFAAVLGAYFCFNVLYSFVLKHIAIVDVISVAAMYVFRVVAGAVIINCSTISPWIIVCTFFLSVLIAVQKRKGEIASTGSGNAEGRSVLNNYTEPMLRDMSVTLGAVTITAYCLYTFQSETSTYMILTIPFVIFGLMRYQMLTASGSIGETPEEIAIKDKPMLIDLTLWILFCILIIYILG